MAESVHTDFELLVLVGGGRVGGGGGGGGGWKKTLAFSCHVSHKQSKIFGVKKV